MLIRLLCASDSSMGASQSAPVVAPILQPQTQQQLLSGRPLPSLHRHALECVCAFAYWRELRVLVLVSRAWRDAVAHMAPIQANLVRSRTREHSFRELSTSALAHHVTKLELVYSGKEVGPLRIHAAQLQQLWAAMPYLTSLSTGLELSEAGILLALPVSSLPRRLRDVSLNLSDQVAPPPEQLRGSMTFLSRFPSLTTLQLLLAGVAAVDFSPLATAAMLRSLDIRSSLNHDSLTAAHVPQLLLLRQLTSLAAPLSSVDFAELLSPPCPLQLEILDPRCPFTEERCAALAHMPSLTVFSPREFTCRNADFVMDLPRLHSFKISFPSSSESPIPPLLPADYARILSAVRRCGGLTQLRLDGLANSSFDPGSEGLTQLLACLPLLESLSLARNGRLDSLSFLRAGTLSATLRDLWLQSIGIRTQAVAEAESLLQLRSLTALSLCSTEFQTHPAVTEQLQALFGQPIQRMPYLKYVM